MNSLTRLYTTYPIDRPVLTIIIVLMISAFLALGSKWIFIDDDFVKMFPEQIPLSKFGTKFKMNLVRQNI